MFSFSEKYESFTPAPKLPFQREPLRCPILNPSVSCCLSEQMRLQWGEAGPLSEACSPLFLKGLALCLHLWSNSCRSSFCQSSTGLLHGSFLLPLFISGVIVVLIKRGVCNDYCLLHSTYISICRRLFSNLLRRGRSASEEVRLTSS